MIAMSGGITDTTTGNCNYRHSGTTACTCDSCNPYDYYYYVTAVDPIKFEDLKELMRLLNLEACRWILKYMVDWALPPEPALKKFRKNNRMMFCKRNLGVFTLIELLTFLLYMVQL